MQGTDTDTGSASAAVPGGHPCRPPPPSRPATPRSALCLIFFAIAGASPGCALLRVGALEDRVGRLESTRDALRADIERERQRLERLRQQAEESTSYLRENGARFGSDLDALRVKVTRVQGGLEELSYQLQAVIKGQGEGRAALEAIDRRLRDLVADLRDRAGIAILALPRELPEDPAEWPALALKAFDAGDVRVADAIARECSKRFAGTEVAGRCGLLQGRIAFEEHRFADAIKLYQGVHDGLDGKAHPVVADALLGLAEVLEAQGKCKAAKELLEYLKTLMKKGAAFDLARARADGQKARCVEGRIVLPPKTSGASAPAPAGAAVPSASPAAAPAAASPATPAATPPPGAASPAPTSPRKP